MHIPRLILEGLIQYVVLLFSLSVHESMHAYTANRFGDPTARKLGRVTLNPIAHMELFGTIADLPLETRHVLAPILGFFSPETSLIARIEMRRLNAEVVDLRLVSLWINGRQFPETALALFLAQVGKQYPALTETGRNLRLRVPRTGLVELEAGGVRLRMVDRR